MTKIKICGLSRPCANEYVKEAQPDYSGLIIGVPKSRRNLSPDTVRELRALLRPEIIPVGVFVNAPQEEILRLTQDGTLSMVQLHGQETGAYIASLREKTDLPIIKAFSVTSPADISAAEESPADHILLDNGSGGTGQVFDWSRLSGIRRPYILAGGLGPDNLAAAVGQLHPWAVDLSSGVETDGKKDRGKILAAVEAVRAADSQNSG